MCLRNQESIREVLSVGLSKAMKGANKATNSDAKKLRCAPLFVAGYGWRWAEYNRTSGGNRIGIENPRAADGTGHRIHVHVDLWAPSNSTEVVRTY